MALSSFMANCFKYLWVSKIKPICIPQIFYEDSEFINHSIQKTSFICFFFIWNIKILKLLAFLSHRDYEQNAYFWKTPVWWMSAQVCGKKYATPLPFIPSPHPSPPPTVTTTPAPSAQGQWYRAFWIRWPPRPMAVAPLAQSKGKPSRSVPAPPPAHRGQWPPPNNSKQAV